MPSTVSCESHGVGDDNNALVHYSLSVLVLGCSLVSLRSMCSVSSLAEPPVYLRAQTVQGCHLH